MKNVANVKKKWKKRKKLNTILQIVLWGR